MVLDDTLVTSVVVLLYYIGIWHIIEPLQMVLGRTSCTPSDLEALLCYQHADTSCKSMVHPICSQIVEEINLRITQDVYNGTCLFV